MGKTVSGNDKLAKEIAGASFHNATFSDRIWMHQDLLRSELSKLLQTGLIAGKHPDVLARDLRKTFGSSRYNAQRLMRTEMARVQTDAQRSSFAANGFDQYEFIAVGAAACPICRAIDGKKFKVKDMLVGENAPPMHPNCRCSTAPAVDEDTYIAWLDSGAAKKGVSFKDFKESVEKATSTLIEKAKKKDGAITLDLKETVSLGLGKLEGLKYRIKEFDSLKRKICNKVASKGESVQQISNTITDVLRYTNVSDNQNFVQDYFKIVETLKQKGYDVIEVANTLKRTDVPYRGVNTLIQDKVGYTFELQFHTPKSLEVKEVNHKLYEEARLSETSKKRKDELNKMMIANANSIGDIKAIEKIVDVERK